MEGLERSTWNPARRCTATNRSGERCWRQPIPGGFVCAVHGGNAPAVREAAQRRLDGMVEPVLDVFEEVVATWRGTRCETCGKPTGDPMPAIRVGQLVLDRAGFHPSLTVKHAVQHDGPLANLTVFEIADRAEELARHAREMADAEVARVNAGAVDGAFVEDGVLVGEDDEVPESADSES